MAEIKEFTSKRKKVKMVDLFAGAGGISEGFLQAYTDDKYFDLLLASDINANCELTHEARYNRQLGLKTKFICQDIMEDSFLGNLLAQIGQEEVDVVTGGPSCQSFSLAGTRKKFDKRDDLFYHYLKVIKALRPKYFVMENVKGILTKDKGRIKSRILSEIRSILDERKLPALLEFIREALPPFMTPFTMRALMAKLNYETLPDDAAATSYQDFFALLEEQLKVITQGLDYKFSKSDENVNTIRHGILMLKAKAEREHLKKDAINLKALCNIGNDFLADGLNDFISHIDDAGLAAKASSSLEAIKPLTTEYEPVDGMAYALRLFTMTFDECVAEIGKTLRDNKSGLAGQFEALIEDARLYKIEKPIVVSSADYGVPQNRERVLFIGCRKDQELITEIPATICEGHKVALYEALWDLDMIKNGETATNYRTVSPLPKYRHLLRARTESGEPNEEGKLYSMWSRIGRLGHRFTFDEEPFYVRNKDELENPMLYQHMELFNHQASNQNKNVRRRLQIIAENGDYDSLVTKERLKQERLKSDKRNYAVLNPERQSPTVCTMPDDFIHYHSYRPLTVREMARLQSFDDTFVFQGKRQTGGNKRKEEIPQYTLVGNAVPPLMAKAIGNVILSKIKL